MVHEQTLQIYRSLLLDEELKALIKNDTKKEYTVIPFNKYPNLSKSLLHSLIIAHNRKYCKQMGIL